MPTNISAKALIAAVRRVVRKNAGKNNEKLASIAKRSGVSRAWLYAFVTGHIIEPSPTKLFALAAAVGEVTVSFNVK